MIIVGGKLVFGMTIDGKEFPLERFSFNSLQLSASRYFFVPQGKLVIADTYGYLKDNPLGDNQSVVIILGNDEYSLKEYQFRIFNWYKQGGTTNVYEIILIYNAPRFINENAYGAYSNMTSSEAIGVIAERSLLDYSGDPTTDRQTWIPYGERRCVTAERIATHGYFDNESYMQLALTLSGELRYKNISNLDYNKAKIFVDGIGLGEPNKVPVTSKREKIYAGQKNAAGGYKMVTVEQNPIDYVPKDFPQYSNVSMRTSSGALLLNKNMVERLEGSITLFSPIDCGNTHANYHKAKHQNLRLAAYYSSGLDLAVVNFPTDVDLLDPINFTPFDIVSGDTVLNDTASGNYFISAKTIFIDGGGVYTEKFHAVRAGYNTNNPPTSQVR